MRGENLQQPRNKEVERLLNLVLKVEPHGKKRRVKGAKRAEGLRRELLKKGLWSITEKISIYPRVAREKICCEGEGVCHHEEGCLGGRPGKKFFGKREHGQ